jgi:uncharacterized protein (TIGR03382 family)
MLRGRLIVAVVVGSVSIAAADSPHDYVHIIQRDVSPLDTTVDTHTLFINRCTGGCAVSFSPTPDNRTDSSDLAAGNQLLSEFSQSPLVWNEIMDCLRDTYSRFNIIVTDVDPGTTPHMEVMVAGLASQLDAGFSSNILGIADLTCQSVGNCQAFQPNALVFAFANSPFFTGAPNDICATAAQEIAHSWALDHVVDAGDPMSYNTFAGERVYKDNQLCGSDCVNGVGPGPFHLPCSGTGGQATHTCNSTGQPTQNEVTTISTLFGPAGPAPTVTITSPVANATPDAGFEIDVDCTASDGVLDVSANVGGVSAGTKTAPPFTFTAPAQLANGPYMVEAICTAMGGGVSAAKTMIIQGKPCSTSSDCDGADVCYDGSCVPGPDATGGLGATCTMNTDCASQMCRDDGTEMHCVLPCDLGSDECPSGFGCLASDPSGVCWPGADSGGGGGCNAGGSGSALVFGMALAGFVVLRRRR